MCAESQLSWFLARYNPWFTQFCGSLLMMVLFRLWLAFSDGSLGDVACFQLWFSQIDGSLSVMVLYLMWLAILLLVSRGRLEGYGKAVW